MLTGAQSEEIEKMQKKVVKLAFGWDRNYEVVCAEQNIESLKVRREQYIDNFVTKTLCNERFSEAWFPLRSPDVHNLRDRRPYKETKSKTNRFYNSPLSFMRRRANDLFSASQIAQSDS